MRVSLKKYILNEIKKEGFISRDKVWMISKTFGHTDATVERVLRPSMSPMIEAVLNENGTISGYKIKDGTLEPVYIPREKGRSNVAYKLNETNTIKEEKQNSIKEIDRPSGSGVTRLVQGALSEQEMRELWDKIPTNAPLHREKSECEIAFRGNQPNLFVS